MAKEYQMLFQLGAKLGQNFSGTFSSAQKVLQQTQKEIQALNRVQSDISAYQRTQQSIKGTTERLDLYKRQLERVHTEIKESGKATAEQSNREDELKQKIKNTEAAINQKNAKLSEMGRKLKDAGVDTSKLSGESERLKNVTIQNPAIVQIKIRIFAQKIIFRNQQERCR